MAVNCFITCLGPSFSHCLSHTPADCSSQHCLWSDQLLIAGHGLFGQSFWYTVSLCTLHFMSHGLVVGIAVVVELPQTPEDDPQKALSCAWKAVELITVVAWVLLVMAMVG